jgi:hypothetical protein
VVVSIARADQSDGLTDATKHAVTLVVFSEEDLPSSGGCSVSHLRCPEAVGIIRVALADTEQEMITEFFPQIQDSTEIDASSRSGGLGCQTWHGLSSPWLAILEAIG